MGGVSRLAVRRVLRFGPRKGVTSGHEFMIRVRSRFMPIFLRMAYDPNAIRLTDFRLFSPDFRFFFSSRNQ